ncbi:Uncharacterized protein LSUE1_G006828 [Lachnellula suecica]|uniref:Uncharacterized protein n=1 Tax=Lachnellula suecica TaxID=602035 RepID=A0A8T9BXE4_9HELO|nr:Uncharacterized protein LSUE1_G006828 [Lachnellula suecica]
MDSSNPAIKHRQLRAGVRVQPAAHGANKLAKTAIPVQTSTELLQMSCSTAYQEICNDHLIHSSFGDIDAEGDSGFLGTENGFVEGAILAYSNHHHLILRPEDIWFTILVQLNIYINEHPEDLRSMFRTHEGRKQLTFDWSKDLAGSALFGADWARFAYQIGKTFEKNIIDPSLREWFMPAFSTTTKSDQTTARIIMMSASQKWSSYGDSIMCGLPSVTLLGCKDDWEKMLERLERLKGFGKEPSIWYGLLKPVLTKFVETFDSPDSGNIKEFWQKIAHYTGGGSGPFYLSGWITAFCFWNDEGWCFHRPGQNPSHEDTTYSNEGPEPVLSLDGARYHRIETKDVPVGWASVPVTLNDNGQITHAAITAGSVGMQISSSSLKLRSGGENTEFDTIQPGSGWWLYEISECHLEKAFRTE